MADEERTPEELRWQHIQEKFDELRVLLAQSEADGCTYVLFVHHLKNGTVISSMNGNVLEFVQMIGWMSEQIGTGFKMYVVVELAEQLRKARAEVLFKIMPDDIVTH